MLVVDDVAANVELLKSMLTREGYSVVTASDGEEALAMVASAHPDLVLMDVLMPKLSGYEVCERIKLNPATRLTPVVLITALHERQHRIQGINAGADDFLTKPVDAHELKARARSLVRLKRYTDDLDSAESVIMSLALVIEARDAYTDGHCQRLAAYATTFGTALKLGEEELAALFRGGYLHDVGKIGIPDEILLKAGRLSESEYLRIKDHPVIGDRLCGELRSLRQVRPIVRHHHERLDGSGYPDGLKGDAIPLLAQIMGIVDVYDAITTARPYKSAATADEGYAELLQRSESRLASPGSGRHIHRPEDRPTTCRRHSTVMTELKRIVLAEDNPNDVELTLAALGEINLANEVVVVRDGAETLDYLYRRNAYAGRPPGNPAVLLLDLKMPKVDGLDVLRALKADEALKTIPVVMLTSSREEQDLIRSYKLGANAYVVKPVDFRSFIDAVRQLGAFWAVVNEPPPGGAVHRTT